MQAVKPTNRKKKLYALLPWFLLLFEVLWFIIFYAVNGRTMIDSDMSSEMILARILNSEGSWLLSTNWYYSTEIRVLYLQFVNKIALMLFSDWHFARTFSITVHLLLFLCSYFYLAHQLKLKNHGVWGSLLLCAPMSVRYSWVVLVGNSYLPHMILIFVCLGSLISAHRHLVESDFWKFGMYALFNIVLSFFTGLTGVRYLMMLYLPVAFTVCTVPLWHRNVESALLLNTKHKRIKTWGMPMLSLLLLAVATIAYAINTYLLSKTYSFYHFSEQYLFKTDLSATFQFLGQIKTLFGYHDGVMLFSRSGIQSVFSIIWVFLLLALQTANFFLWKRLQIYQRGFVIISTFLLISNVIICSITNKGIDIYLVIPIVLFAISSFMCLQFIPKSHDIFRKYICVILAVGLMIFYIKPNVDVSASRKTAGLYHAQQWLQEQGYENGYATFWYGNITTEMSNDKLKIWVLSDSFYTSGWKSLGLSPWLQEKDHFSISPEGKVFVILTESEYAQKPVYASSDYLVYSNDGFVIFSYESDQQLKDLLK